MESGLLKDIKTVSEMIMGKYTKYIHKMITQSSNASFTHPDAYARIVFTDADYTTLPQDEIIRTVIHLLHLFKPEHVEYGILFQHKHHGKDLIERMEKRKKEILNAPQSFTEFSINQEGYESLQKINKEAAKGNLTYFYMKKVSLKELYPITFCNMQITINNQPFKTRGTKGWYLQFFHFFKESGSFYYDDICSKYIQEGDIEGAPNKEDVTGSFIGFNTRVKKEYNTDQDIISITKDDGSTKYELMAKVKFLANS